MDRTGIEPVMPPGGLAPIQLMLLRLLTVHTPTSSSQPELGWWPALISGFGAIYVPRAIGVAPHALRISLRIHHQGSVCISPHFVCYPCADKALHYEDASVMVLAFFFARAEVMAAQEPHGRNPHHH